MSKIKTRIASLVAVGALAGLAVLPLAVPAYAVDTAETTEVQVTITDTINIGSSNADGAITWTLTPEGSTPVTGSTQTETITGSRNSGAGFHITGQTNTTDGSLTLNPASPAVIGDATGGTGGPIGSGTGATLATNKWGVKFAAGAGDATATVDTTVANWGNYVGLNSTAKTVANTTGVGERAFTASYDVSVNSTVPVGVYDALITYTIVAN
jgi:hypothetical protein